MEHKHSGSRGHQAHAESPPLTHISSGQYVCPMCPGVLEETPGDCPICGMALQPMSLDRALLEDDTELRDMLRLFWISLPLSAALLVLTMGEMIPGVDFRRWLGDGLFNWTQALLATPVLFWCGRLFLNRGWN